MAPATLLSAIRWHESTPLIMQLVATGLATISAGTLLLGVWFVFSPIAAEARSDARAGVSAFFRIAIKRLGAFSRPFLSLRYESRLRKMLAIAGYPFGFFPEDIVALHGVSFFGGAVFGLLLCSVSRLSYFTVLVCALVGACYPLIWLRDNGIKRQLLISKALPFSLDLLTLSVEAGLDFTGSLAKVVDKGRPGPLRDELAVALKELKMGQTREQSLKALSERCQHAGLAQFVMALIQADRMGSSLGKTLRIQSAQLRQQRSVRAETLAAQAPVKMLLPLTLFIFPTIFLVIFGPIVFALMVQRVAG